MVHSSPPQSLKLEAQAVRAYERQRTGSTGFLYANRAVLPWDQAYPALHPSTSCSQANSPRTMARMRHRRPRSLRSAQRVHPQRSTVPLPWTLSGSGGAEQRCAVRVEIRQGPGDRLAGDKAGSAFPPGLTGTPNKRQRFQERAQFDKTGPCPHLACAAVVCVTTGRGLGRVR